MVARSNLWLACAMMLFLPAVAHAQSTIVNQVQHDPQWTTILDRPNQGADGFIVECAYPAGGCQQFNRAMCDIDKPFRLIINRGASSPTFQGAASQFNPLAWLQRGGGACSTNPTGDANTTVVGIPGREATGTATVSPASPSSVFYAGGTQALVIPDSFGSAGQTWSTKDMMQAFSDVCSEDGINFSTFRVCFGIGQSNVIGSTTSTTSTTDITGYWQFPVDTRPPEVPNIDAAKSLVSRVDLNMSFANTALDMSAVNVRFTSDPNLVGDTDKNIPGVADCSTWGSAQTTSVSVAATDVTASIEIPGVNGVTYAYCAQAVDLVGNGSKWSTVATATPHPECDYFDCYPGDLQVGFCAAGLPPEWYALAATAWLYRRTRRRQA